MIATKRGQIILEKYKTAQALFLQMAKRHNMSVSTFRTSRLKENVRVRIKYIHAAYKLGCGTIIIANILWKHESTILYHLSPGLRIQKELRRLAYCARNTELRAA